LWKHVKTIINYFLQVNSLIDFFKDDTTVFIAYGHERCATDDFDLDDNGKCLE